MIQPKFNIGDIVYTASFLWSETEEQCPDCLGKLEWQVKTPSGDEFNIPCGTCMRGYFSCGKVRNWADNSFVNIRTIGSVRIDTANEKPISYMCGETGVGTGTVYYEENIFDNHDAALAKAKELTAIAIASRVQSENNTINNNKKQSRRKPTYEERKIKSLEKEIASLQKELAKQKALTAC